ncbi:MAG: AAA family ATPase [Clostridia bacterium]|nr:AAA family ATPase [Clostridia bacterium]
MVLVVTSGKGGVGKSTVCVGLSAAFCRNGKKVLLIDTDEGLRCIDGMLGVSENVMLDLSDAQNSPEDYKQTVTVVDKISGLSVIAAPSEFGVITPEKFGEVIKNAEKDYDIVMIDCPAGVDEKYYSALPMESRVLVVTNSDAAAINGAMNAGLMVKRLGIGNVRLILNKFSGKKVGRLHDNVDAIVDRTGMGLMGVIPYDEEIIKSSAKNMPSEWGRGSMAFSRIAARINGARILLPKSGRI